jgi:hypothetical protein
VSDVDKILLTSALTVVVGVLVFVAGQIVQRFVLEPAQELQKLRGEVGDALIFYGNVFGSGDIHERERRLAMMEAVRKLAGRLRVQPYVIFGYGVLARLKLVPRRDDLLEASRLLIFLSNSASHTNHSEILQGRRDIARILGLKIE